MSKLLSLPLKILGGRKTTFSKRELNQLLSLYGERVTAGLWRDYALDCLQDRAVFSVFKSAREQPLYSVIKIGGNGSRKASRYLLMSGQKTLWQGNSLQEALEHIQQEQA